MKTFSFKMYSGAPFVINTWEPFLSTTTEERAFQNQMEVHLLYGMAVHQDAHDAKLLYPKD